MSGISEDPLRPEHLRRADETDDGLFYETPRLVVHIDEPACAALAEYYGHALPPGGDILDLMSSYASHLPPDAAYGSVIGLGMNETELEANPQLTGHRVHDLNRFPTLPFDDGSFDACVLAVSVQYLVEPAKVFAETARVLRPGAPFAITYSNRLFPTKAVALWQALDAAKRAKLVDLYFSLAGGFEKPAFEDLSPHPGSSDPLYVVSARRAYS